MALHTKTQLFAKLIVCRENGIFAQQINKEKKRHLNFDINTIFCCYMRTSKN